MDETYLWMRLYQGIQVILYVLLVLVVLTGIRVRQSLRTNRLLKSIDQSLKLLPGVAGRLRNVA